MGGVSSGANDGNGASRNVAAGQGRRHATPIKGFNTAALGANPFSHYQKISFPLLPSSGEIVKNTKDQTHPSLEM